MDAHSYAVTIAEELEELEAGRLDDEHYGAAWEAQEVWQESAVLDVEVTRSLAGEAVSGVTITRTVGGPGCWIEANGDGRVRVEAVWGSDRAYVTADAPTVDAWAWELAEVTP